MALPGDLLFVTRWRFQIWNRSSGLRDDWVQSDSLTQHDPVFVVEVDPGKAKLLTRHGIGFVGVDYLIDRTGRKK